MRMYFSKSAELQGNRRGDQELCRSFHNYDNSDRTMEGGFPSPKRRSHHNHRKRLLSIGENAMDGQDLISHLPDECVQVIFSFLPSSRDRCTCAAVSKKWLLLLAHMRGSEFKRPVVANGNGGGDEGSRCLEAEEANDARVAAMAVGTYSRKLLSQLSLRGGVPSFSQTQGGITDFGLQVISQSFPNLKSLALWDCFNITSIGIACIAECCPVLEKLDISHSARIDDSGLVPIARNCPNLSTLIIDSCRSVGNQALEAFAKFSAQLESISITKCPLVGDVGIISMVTQLPKLSRIRLASLSLGDGVLEAIGKHTGLIKTLCLENLTGLTMAVSSDVSFGLGGETFGGLKHVDIKCCQYLTDLALLRLTKSTSLLETLKLERCDGVTTHGLMGALKNCRETLRVLSLIQCNGIGSHIEEDGETSYPSLHSITFKKCHKIEDIFLSRMAPACAHIKHIGLVGLTSITDRGVVSLLQRTTSATASETQAGGTAYISLSGCVNVTDWSVLALAKAFGARLKSLSLEGCRRLGDWSLVVLGELCPSLVELDVSRCGVSDGGVAMLVRAEHQKLEVLSLAGCWGITDKSLSCLEVMCGGLVGLNLKHCRGVTRSGVDSVRATLWWCDLLY